MTSRPAAGRGSSGSAASPCRPPDLVAGAKHRPSKAARWRALVLVLVHLAIAAHIAHWLASGKAATLSPVEPSEAERFARESVINTGLIFFALTILSTLALGRWFCGWACHLVAIQDACRWLLLKVGVTPRPLRSRWMATVPLLAALYLFVWPVVPRILAGEDLALRGVELTRSGFWDTFPPWIPAVITFVVCGALAVYFLGAKGFCTYGCPYGAVFGLADRVAPGRIRVTDACVRCGHCSLVCTSNVDVSREVHEYGMVVDPGCMKCFDCVTVCPEDALYFGFGKPALGAKPRVAALRKVARLPWTEEALALLACAYAYVAMRGFNQGSGLLLSVGVATTVAGLALFAARTLRRADVALPGVPLKRAGRLRPAGAALWLALGAAAILAVPFGVWPEVNAWRAGAALRGLEPARLRWEAASTSFGLVELTSEERERGAALARAARRVDAGSWVVSQHNAVREAWGRLLAGERAEAVAPLRSALAIGPEHPLLWTLLGDAQTPAGAQPGPEAIEAYTRAVELGAGATPAAARLVQRLVQCMTVEPGDSDLARHIVAVLDRFPFEGATGAELKGEVLFYGLVLGAVAPERALGELQAAVDVHPNKVELRLKLASLLAQGGALGDALAVLEAAPDPSDPRVAGFVGELRAALGQR
ncbi:MAG: 4Fe-4S binding protein [Planctomycetota bacterium]